MPTKTYKFRESTDDMDPEKFDELAREHGYRKRAAFLRHLVREAADEHDVDLSGE